MPNAHPIRIRPPTLLGSRAGPSFAILALLVPLSGGCEQTPAPSAPASERPAHGANGSGGAGGGSAGDPTAAQQSHTDATGNPGDAAGPAAADHDAGAPSAGWPGPRFDAAATAQSATALRLPLALAWSAEVDDVPLLDPVSDGERVYAASTATRLSAHELRTGRRLWSVPLPSDATASPAVADGLVYVGTFEGHLLCVDAATGQTLWTFQAEDQLAGSPNVVALQDGRKLVLVSSWDTHVYAVLGGREGGSLLWKQATQDRVNGMPVVAGGRVYVGGCDAVLYAFALEDGSPLWQTGVQSYIPANVALSAGAGVVVAGLHEDANALVAIDTGTGKLRWQTPRLGFPYTAPPAVHSTGLVVAGSRDRQVRAHHLRDGSTAWSAAIGASVDVPVSLTPQHVVLPTSDARLLLLSIHDGSTLQTLSLPVRSETAPALAGQWVVVASRDGRLHAFAPAAKAVPR